MPPGATSRSQVALAYLREQIVSGRWPINSRIPTEPELMEILGVGRTSVREAVRSLASVGMLEALVSRGTYVRSRFPVSSVLGDFLASFDAAELVVLRRALEVEAARQAALHRDTAGVQALRDAIAADVPDAPGVAARTAAEHGTMPGQFHHLVFEASGNRLLVNLYGGVMAGMRAALSRAEVVFGSSADTRRADHTLVADAIEAADAEAAARAMAAHDDRDLVVADLTVEREPAVTLPERRPGG